MNNLLRNLIEIKDVATFIDDVMVEIETEKYVQKVREIGFLEIVIELDKVKIEKKKVQKVVDQPVLRGVENVQKFLELVNYYRQFVKDFVRIEKPFYKIMKKNVK